MQRKILRQLLILEVRLDLAMTDHTIFAFLFEEQIDVKFLRICKID